VVKKEPDYRCQHPFRGVVNLGSERYAFALDATQAEKQPETPDKDAEASNRRPEGNKQPPNRLDAIRYDRLYFDRNRNGDLTDDTVIKAQEQPNPGPYSASFRSTAFPRVDVTINVDGTKLDYAFLITVYSQGAEDYRYVQVSLNAAAYREGEITLYGKRRHIVVLDFNSNGRFDDPLTVVQSGDGRLYSSSGDQLLVAPSSSEDSASSFRPTADRFRCPMSKIVSIDRRFYDLEISPAGDKLTLTPSSAPVGHVTTPHKGLSALMHSGERCLRIAANEDEESKPIPLPEGDWKLVEYTIDRTGYKPEEEGTQGASLLEALSGALAPPRSARRPTQVSAQGTTECKPVRVREGKTVALPFGPPFKPVVEVAYGAGREEVQLGMSLVGSGGEKCSSLIVDGRQPDGVPFTISTADGDEVVRDTFRFG
jgi:hypothetical protein